MKLEAAKCPSCGANLSVNPNEKVMTCEFCGGSVTVKEAIRLYKGAVETVKGEAEKERLVEMAEDCYKNEFYNEAAETFALISKEYPNDYRGWWGMIKCRDILEDVLDRGFFHNYDEYDEQRTYSDLYKRAIAFAPQNIKSKIEQCLKLRNDYISLMTQYNNKQSDIRDFDRLIGMLDENSEKNAIELEQCRKNILNGKITYILFSILTLTSFILFFSSFNFAWLIISIFMYCCLCACSTSYKLFKNIKWRKSLEETMTNEQKIKISHNNNIDRLKSEIEFLKDEMTTLEKEAKALTAELRRS